MVTVRRSYFVYILTNRRNGTLYTGVTSELRRRTWQHKNDFYEGFSKRYGLKRLVYFEVLETSEGAIRREKQIKAGSRKKKLALIEKDNPNWTDLSEGWFEGS